MSATDSGTAARSLSPGVAACFSFNGTVRNENRLMLSEFNLFGVFMAPIVVYAVAALPVTMLLRSLLWWCGIMKWFWHLALFEVALYTCVLCLMILYI
ncbi:hypothetical protein AA0616_0914 [Komagataeibacter nataicola NRIC 0616]|nr:hypothetical protein AA15973_1863 [Komagataeibacter sucrofermentans DSM 15973]GBR16902.1 hypothetical protein AA0616_0914 [Komagataeibacter nataicola NRIC 0616]